MAHPVLVGCSRWKAGRLAATGDLNVPMVKESLKLALYNLIYSDIGLYAADRVGLTLKEAQTRCTKDLDGARHYRVPFSRELLAVSEIKAQLFLHDFRKKSIFFLLFRFNI